MIRWSGCLLAAASGYIMTAAGAWAADLPPAPAATTLPSMPSLPALTPSAPIISTPPTHSTDMTLPDPTITPTMPAVNPSLAAPAALTPDKGGKIEPLSTIPALPAIPNPLSGAPMSNDALPPPPPVPGTEAVQPVPVANAGKKAETPKHTKKSKHNKHRKKIEGAVPDENANGDYRVTGVRVRLPANVYRKHYDPQNRHLPTAHYEGDYDALLFLTAEQNNLNGLRALLDAGRNVETVNAEGDTPLLAAVRNGAVTTTRLLLARHANPDVRDRSGQTPLAIATRSGNESLRQALLESGAQ